MDEKIIQIAIDPSNESSPGIIYALTESGKIYYKSVTSVSGQWLLESDGITTPKK